MTLKVIEGSWDEILQHAQELQGRRLRVTVLPEPAPKRTGADLLQTLTEIGFIRLNPGNYLSVVSGRDTSLRSE